MMSNPASVSVNSPTIPTQSNHIHNLPSLNPSHDDAVAMRRNSSSLPPSSDVNNRAAELGLSPQHNNDGANTDGGAGAVARGEQRSYSAPPPKSIVMGYEAWRIGSTESLSKNVGSSTAANSGANNSGGPLSPLKNNGEGETVVKASNLHEQSVAFQQTKSGELFCVCILNVLVVLLII
jgi:hypothetical protein